MPRLRKTAKDSSGTEIGTMIHAERRFADELPHAIDTTSSAAATSSLTHKVKKQEPFGNGTFRRAPYGAAAVLFLLLAIRSPSVRLAMRPEPGLGLVRGFSYPS